MYLYEILIRGCLVKKKKKKGWGYVVMYVPGTADRWPATHPTWKTTKNKTTQHKKKKRKIAINKQSSKINRAAKQQHTGTKLIKNIWTPKLASSTRTTTKAPSRSRLVSSSAEPPACERGRPESQPQHGAPTRKTAIPWRDGTGQGRGGGEGRWGSIVQL